MVMVNRSNRKQVHDVLVKSNLPPWCSLSRQRHEIKKPKNILTARRRSPTHLSSTQVRDNIWDILREKERDLDIELSKIHGEEYYQTAIPKLFVVSLLLLLLCLLGSFYQSMPEIDFVWQETMGEECCTRIRQLHSALHRAENALRRIRRHRAGLVLSSRPTIDNVLAVGFDETASIHVSEETVQWHGRTALWGVVPLWWAVPSPRVLLQPKPPTPADCWPFRGSSGEVVIEGVRRFHVRALSVEHVRPDLARSAPRRFQLHAILANGTWTKGLESEYVYGGPAKQFYSVDIKVPIRQVAFRVLTNHGNPNYTCVYRVQVYGVFV